MEDTGMATRWSMALLPDMAMIPGRSVFLQATGGVSLTATGKGLPGLLPNIWEQFRYTCGEEVEEACYYREQLQARDDMPSSGQASGV